MLHLNAKSQSCFTLVSSSLFLPSFLIMETGYPVVRPREEHAALPGVLLHFAGVPALQSEGLFVLAHDQSLLEGEGFLRIKLVVLCF